MANPFTYEDWETGKDVVIPYPTREAFLVARQIMEADEYGPLHIIVADGNVEDDHIGYCEKRDDLSSSDRALIQALRALDVPQRQAAWHYAAYGQLNDPARTIELTHG